ncbi:hypothetical protein LTR17_004210 [Elasticomyces elasticus]|nr:hypothetical protein LTR17_004210 [Elasticomyces elasticus]
MATTPRLGQLFLRTVWIFQAIAAGPIFFCLGMLAIFNMFNTFDTLYEFFTHLITALLAAAIIFIVVVQRTLPPDATSKTLTLRFEISKSILATALWLWLLFDAIFGPRNHSGYYMPRSQRIAVAGISSILPLILFYPTVVYTAVYMRHTEQYRQEPEAVDERSPLLQS